MKAAAGYQPDEVQALGQLEAGEVHCALIVGPHHEIGRELSQLFDLVAELKWLPAPEQHLPRGVYWFHSGSNLMIVTGDGLSSDPLAAETMPVDPHDPLRRACDWFEHWWDGVASPVPSPKFRATDEVVLTGRREVVDIRSRQLVAGRWAYEIRLDGAVQSVTEVALAPAPTSGGPVDWVTQGVAPAKRFAATLTRAKLRDRFTDTVFSFRASRTLFRSYQFKPIMKLLQTGRSRLLIADEVGLGKTIEAGLVWTELEARRQADRVLVVCPAVLVSKWKREMDERFGFELRELSGDTLDEWADKVSTGRLPGRAAYVASLQTLRKWPRLEEVSDFGPTFDLVVVDEAHSMRNPETASYALGSLLSEWAESLLFLTATPVNLRTRDLYSLMQLLVPGELGDPTVFELQLEPNAVLHGLQAALFDQTSTSEDRVNLLGQLRSMTFGAPILMRPEARLVQELVAKDPMSSSDVAQARQLLQELNTTSAVVTRTRKIEVEEFKAVREPQNFEVTWCDRERTFYEEHLQWCRARATAADMPLYFAMQMPLRLASSCLPAAAKDVLEWRPTSTSPQDDDVYGETPATIQIPPHAELTHAAAALEGVDSKFEWLRSALRDLRKDGHQCLLFTFSRATLAYLASRLAVEFRIGELHGGVDKAGRHEVMKRFRDGDFDVVLATRVASEGLDFEFCSAVINYDLPWNPMEVEQRIGRLDRIGQTAPKILILNFMSPETIEASIVERIYARIRVFEHSIGELEPILNDVWDGLQKVAFDFSLTQEQRMRQVDQTLAAVETKRRLLEDVEEASRYLLTSDEAAVDGLEEDLVKSGRYVGQRELATLVEDWYVTAGGRRFHIDDEQSVLTITCSPGMLRDVENLARSGERTRAEVGDLLDLIRAELDVYLALSTEVSRTQGLEFLASSHPLVRAAARASTHEAARFSAVRVQSADVSPGTFLVQVAVATWVGVRPSVEVWTSAVDVLSGREAPGVGDLLLAALAAGTLVDSEIRPSDLTGPVRRTESLLVARQLLEEASRQQLNDALVEARRSSVMAMHERRLSDIRNREQTLRQRGDERMARLFVGQTRRAQQQLDQTLAELDERSSCGLHVEPLAVCVVEVVP